MDNEYGELTFASSSSYQRSGASRRKAANILPQPFLLYDVGQPFILGAFCICKCWAYPGESHITFAHSGLHLLDRPVAVPKAELAYESTVFRLQPKLEETVRMSLASIGGG